MVLFRKNKLVVYIGLLIMSLDVSAQNCGSISAWSFTETSVGGGNSSYTINFDALSTSGGDKGVQNLIIACSTTTLNTNTACYITAPSTGSPYSYSYSFTAASCGGTLTLNYTGKTNNACGGSACFTGSASAPVPVEWLSAKASCETGYPVINWSTAQETDNHGFEIEVLKAGNWEKVGWVDGQGNSSSRTDYIYPLNEIEHDRYRIVQHDYDGKKSYSSVLKLECTREKGLVLYPNPIETSLNFSSEVSELTIYDAIGAVLFETNDYIKEVNLVDICASGYYSVSYMFEGKLYHDKILVK